MPTVRSKRGAVYGLVVWDVSPMLPQLDIGDRLPADIEVRSDLRLHSVVLADRPDVIRRQVCLVVSLA